MTRKYAIEIHSPNPDWYADVIEGILHSAANSRKINGYKFERFDEDGEALSSEPLQKAIALLRECLEFVNAEPSRRYYRETYLRDKLRAAIGTPKDKGKSLSYNTEGK